MRDNWNNVNELLPPEGKVVEVIVAQGYLTLAKVVAGKWCNIRGEEVLSAVTDWREGNRTKLDGYVAGAGK